MHYRRMDPQPHPDAVFSTKLRVLPPVYSGNIPISHARGPSYVTNDWHGDQYTNVVDVPKDMMGATPWRDKDGTWYWRQHPLCAWTLTATAGHRFPAPV